MTRRTAYIVIICFILLLVGGFLVFYFYTNRGQDTLIVETPHGNIFPNTPSGAPSQNRPPTVTPPSNTTVTPSANTAAEIPALRELSNHPTAGGVALTASTSISYRFIERGSGNVYEVSPTTDGETRLSNTTIPKIQEAFWSGDGTHIIARYIDETTGGIKTYSGTLNLPTGSTEGSLEGSYLANNISSIAVNASLDTVFYLVTGSAGSIGITTDMRGEKRNQIFDSSISEWIPSWTAKNSIALTSKASADVSGFLYFLNTKTGILTPAISNIRGLTTLPNADNSRILYSETGGDGVTLKTYIPKTGASKEIGVRTLPEKCVWSKTDSVVVYCAVPIFIGSFTIPDDWYRGVASFADEIWKINTETGSADLLSRLDNSLKKEIDATNLAVSAHDEYLFFINKKDFHPWSLRVSTR